MGNRGSRGRPAGVRVACIGRMLVTPFRDPLSLASLTTEFPALAARTIAALLTLRDQVIAPILAAVRSPRMGRKPAHWTRAHRDYERIRIDMQALFTDIALQTPLAA